MTLQIGSGWQINSGWTATPSPVPYSITYLIVAGGGGGGGGFDGAGGGAGGYITQTVTVAPGSPVTIVVGNGGKGAIGTCNSYTNGASGNVSYINSTPTGNIVAQGGGVGAGGSVPGFQIGAPGGSGGGGSNDAGIPGLTGGLGTGGQGYPGGTAVNGPSPSGLYDFGGGGGGSSGAGASTAPTTTSGLPGGTATLWPYTGVYYAGGGGGGSRFLATPVGYGGGVAPGNPAKGGAGDGASRGDCGGNAIPNFGSGGGGSGAGGGCAKGGAGGSGIVILAVPTLNFKGSPAAPGANITTAPPSYPGVTLLTYTTPSPISPSTYTFTP